jgi:hypothetical protein
MKAFLLMLYRKITAHYKANPNTEIIERKINHFPVARVSEQNNLFFSLFVAVLYCVLSLKGVRPTGFDLRPCVKGL